MLIDTHCHLDAAEFDPDRAEIRTKAQAAGVEEIWIPAVSVANFPAVKACCLEYQGCRPAYGIHPLYSSQAGDDDLLTLAHWLDVERPLAVGEIGLDYFVEGIDREHQNQLFAEQLKLARKFELPVLLHVRRAVDDVLKQLRYIGVRGGIAHAFNGSLQQAETFIKLGFKLGFGGSLTFPGSTRIRTLATMLPLDSIVLETDAPDMPPCWLQGARNTPDQLPRIARELAELRRVPLSEVWEATHQNAKHLCDQ